MRGLSREELLRLFELGPAHTPLEQGLELLARAWPEADEAIRRALPLAERDRLLLALRVASFGPMATVTAPCPDCDSKLETELDLRRLLEAPAPDDPFAIHELEHEGRRYAFRLPSTADLEAVLADPTAEDVHHRLVRSTLVREEGAEDAEGDAEGDADGDDDGDDGAPLTDGALEAIAAAWDRIDPLSEIRLGFACPACGRDFDPLFDIVDLLRAEIGAHARRLLLDVHALASAYGWTEDQVLALGESRRRLYVEMVS